MELLCLGQVDKAVPGPIRANEPTLNGQSHVFLVCFMCCAVSFLGNRCVVLVTRFSYSLASLLTRGGPFRS